jgi:molybdenum cofactor biosynthesis enzyme MoaA
LTLRADALRDVLAGATHYRLTSAAVRFARDVMLTAQEPAMTAVFPEIILSTAQAA